MFCCKINYFGILFICQLKKPIETQELPVRGTDAAWKAFFHFSKLQRTSYVGNPEHCWDKMS